MELIIKPTARISKRDIYGFKADDLLITFFQTPIEADFSDELSEEDESKPKKIGYIYAWRFDLDFSGRDLTYLADEINSDLCSCASFFFLEEGEESLSYNYLFYIEKVFIKPEYRGHGYALQALAMFLQLFAPGETVCCHPSHQEDLRDKYSGERGKLLMRKYWSKVGLNRYSEKHNILWAEEWDMPAWLMKQIFGIGE